MKLTKLFLFLASISALVISSDSSVLAAATGTFDVKTSVVASCNITLPASIVFAAYDPLSATPDDNTSQAMTIACSQGSVTHISLNYGSTVPLGPAAMGNGASGRLLYELHKDSLTGALWNGADLQTGTAPSTAARSFTIYGRIPALQDVPVGSYTDTVTATVLF
jgi:spore coat protein U-like protein